MKIYNSGSYGRAHIFVSPGVHHPERIEWIDARTREPLTMQVKFTDGVADVEPNFGRYLIEHGYGTAKPI